MKKVAAVLGTVLGATLGTLLALILNILWLALTILGLIWLFNFIF